MNKIILSFGLLLVYITIIAQEDTVITGQDRITIQENPPLKTKIGGYARGVLVAGSPEFDIPLAFGEFALQAKLSTGRAMFYADVRMREGLFYDQQEGLFGLKEAYAAFLGKHLEIYLGNQVITWGRVDGFNPTNQITPTDYFFLSNEPDDQKLSNFLIRSRLLAGNYFSLELIAIPFFRPSVYRYDLFDMGQGVSFSSDSFPPFTFENAGFAARLNFDYPAAGFSFSGFHGFSTFYGFKNQKISIVPDLLIENAPLYFKKNVLGADLELPLKSFIIRSELAFTHTNKMADSLIVPKPDFDFVAGLEKEILGWNFILQYMGKFVPDFSDTERPVLANPMDPSEQLKYARDLAIYESTLMNRKIFRQQEKMNHALLLSLQKFFAYEILNLELSAYYNFTSEEWLLRPKLSWKITDVLSLDTGASFMLGPDGELFDYAGDVLNGVCISLTFKF